MTIQILVEFLDSIYQCQWHLSHGLGISVLTSGTLASIFRRFWYYVHITRGVAHLLDSTGLSIPTCCKHCSSWLYAYATGQLFKMSAWHLLAILHQPYILVIVPIPCTEIVPNA